jgi:hypothetical protein
MCYPTFLKRPLLAIEIRKVAKWANALHLPILPLFYFNDKERLLQKCGMAHELPIL